MTDELYIGLMSGTSMDGIDAALVEIGHQSCNILNTVSPPYPAEVRRKLESLVTSSRVTDLNELGTLHVRIARVFADAVADLLRAAVVSATDITAVGSHGQTILHSPEGSDPFSMQLGDPGTLAALTGITVVADFRNTDIALGGQGAPLVPAFHRWAFGVSGASRAVVNIGGIANVTLIDSDGTTTGFDTGPGNVLMDVWHDKHRSKPFDTDGEWAATGNVDATLLDQMQADPYFKLAPPKSTGREYFNLTWLQAQLDRYPAAPAAEDVQATLSELTAREIARGLQASQKFEEIFVCGGGAENRNLLGRLERALPDSKVSTTAELGIDPAWVEAAAFAWLAQQRLLGMPTNVPTVTGASKAASLGGIFLPP